MRGEERPHKPARQRTSVDLGGIRTIDVYLLRVLGQVTELVRERPPISCRQKGFICEAQKMLATRIAHKRMTPKTVMLPTVVIPLGFILRVGVKN